MARMHSHRVHALINPSVDLHDSHAHARVPRAQRAIPSGQGRGFVPGHEGRCEQGHGQEGECPPLARGSLSIVFVITHTYHTLLCARKMQLVRGVRGRHGCRG
jgi:hypothetical protein